MNGLGDWIRYNANWAGDRLALDLGEEQYTFEAMEAVDGKIRLVGNINNPTTLYARGPKEVRQEVYRALDAGVQLIAPECAIPLKTKAENLVEIPLAVEDWAAEHGMA